MNTSRLVPVIPESAPFTAEQRAWLNGFLAGLFSYTPVPNPPAPTHAPSQTPTLAPLAILVGSQTGTAEKLAKRIAKTAAQRGFAPVIHDLSRSSPSQLSAESSVLFVTSTYGDGEPPDNAKAFWQSLRDPNAPRLEKTRFSICALGDSQYPRFCQFGKDLDARLESLGAHRIHPRQDCDVEFEQPFASWIGAALDRLAPQTPGPGSISPPSPTAAPLSTPDSRDTESEETSRWHRDRPFPARLTENLRLTAPESEKDVRHFAIDLLDSDLAYQAGDALGVWPETDPQLVHDLLETLGFDGSEAVPDRRGQSAALRQALTQDYDITRIPRALLEYAARHTQDATLAEVTSPTANGALDRFLRGRDVLDLFRNHPSLRPSPTEFVALLRKIQPRLYSIASSPRLHPRSIHLCVNVVRYQSLNRTRHGLASAWLADRLRPETPLPIYIHTNTAFRPPAPDQPLIMIGPGTGIAPFRAFLQDRMASGATGRNWLFFGAPHERSEFLYGDEIRTWTHQRLLTHLDLAWSRDHADKVYVQHRMLANAVPFWNWLESGASVYVCGDASRMAKDVDAGLHSIIQQVGQRSPEQAAEYVRGLVAAGRYRRDVY